MRRLAQKAPAMGPRKLLVIGRAEAMTPGMGSPEAANALLKLLEEPPDDTTLILTSDVPGALLPTIRSRVQAVRVAPLSGDRVSRFLRERLGIDAAEAARLAGKSGGSIGRALELRDGDGADTRQTAMALARASIAGSLGPQLAVAHGFRGFGARGSFGLILSEATALLRDLLASTAGAAEAVSDPDAAGELAGGVTFEPYQILDALEALEVAKELADRNVNPQLIVANLSRLHGVSALGADRVW
jgi:DNA polymerase-3 subunit delta'